MNKVAAAVLAVAMVGSMAVPAFATAAGTNDEAGNYTSTGTTITGTEAQKSRQTEVKYDVVSSYTWTIHDTVDFTNKTVSNSKRTNGDGTSENAVSVTKNVIPASKKLRITVKGTGTEDAFSIKTDDNSSLSYTVKVGASGTELAVGGTVMDVAAGTNSDTKYMVYELTTDSVEKAGAYTGYVVYTADIVDKSKT